MNKVDKLRSLVIKASNSASFIHHKWFIKYHLNIVERLSSELNKLHPEADKDLVRTLVWIHDYGKILGLTDLTQTEMWVKRLMTQVGFEKMFIDKAIKYLVFIEGKDKLDLKSAPIEVKIVSSADGASHFVGPFFSLWFYENSNKPIEELMVGNQMKSKKDWEKKIVLPEVKKVFGKRREYVVESNGRLPKGFMFQKTKGRQLSRVTRQELWEKGRKVVLMAPQLFVDVDIEADGVAGCGSMLSLGAQSPTGESFYSEIKPACDDFIQANREFCENHGLQRERLIKEAPDFRRVMSDFSKWVEDLKKKTGKPVVFTAFNAAFDWSFVDLYFRKAGIDENPFGIYPFDLKSLYLSLTKDWDWGDTSKSKLPPIIVPDEEFTHNALEDAQYQQKLHFGVAGILGEKNFRQIISDILSDN